MEPIVNSVFDWECNADVAVLKISDAPKSDDLNNWGYLLVTLTKEQVERLYREMHS